MFTLLRCALFFIGYFFATELIAAPELARLRSGVGIGGHPVQLAGILDVNRNGRPELLLRDRFHISIVEETAGPRRYTEVARLDAPGSAEYEGALLVDVPGEAPALLLRWSTQAELRDTSTLAVKAVLPGSFSSIGIGDVDGDGIPDIVLSTGGTIGLFNPITLEPNGSFVLSSSYVLVADILGDSRAEIISDDSRAFQISRSGSTLLTNEVWNAGTGGRRFPYVMEFGGNPSLLLLDAPGSVVALATFRPEISQRPLSLPPGSGRFAGVADANGDGRVDLLAVTSHTVRAIDIETGLTLWERETIYQTPYLGYVWDMATIDLDGDGIVELVWSDASYNSGIVAMSMPLDGPPRWRSAATQAGVTDWTLVARPSGRPSIAYLTFARWLQPRISSLGFLDAWSFADQGGSAFSWLPGYEGTNRRVTQHSITVSPIESDVGDVVVAGAELPLGAVNPVARYLWTFSGEGALRSERTLPSTTSPDRIVAAQVLDRPERQIVVAGKMPELPVPGSAVYSSRVEIIDYATGNLLWQSVQLPSYPGALVTKLQVGDLDADGGLEIVVAYGTDVKVFKPAISSNAAATYVADTFSLLDRGVGRTWKLATLSGTDFAAYDGVSTMPEKTFVLPSVAYGLAVFEHAPDDAILFATSDFSGTTVRRYVDGEVVTSNINFPSSTLAAMDLDGDHRTEIIGENLEIWRLDNDYVFRGGFDAIAQ